MVVNCRKQHLNVILANAPINNGNRGCVALTYSVVYILNRILSEKSVDYTLYVLDTSLLEESIYPIKLVDKVIKISPLSYPVGIGVKENLKLWAKCGKLFHSLRTFRDADYILDIGQGDSFADIYGNERFQLIDRIHCLARLFRKPYCILPQTIGPFSQIQIKKRADKSIRKASLVMARDGLSLGYVKQQVPEQKKVDEFLDVAFFLPFKKVSFDEKYVHVGLNISALLWNGGYTRDNQFGLKANYSTTIRAVINYFLSLTDVMLHIVPHVVLQERNVENDYEVSYNLIQEFAHERLVLAPFFLDPVEAKSYISGMDFFMGARMHSTIAAYSSGVPVVPMAYSRKFNGLFIDTLGYEYMVDLKTEDSAHIVNRITECYNNREFLKAKIVESQGVVEERKEKVLSELRKFFKLDDN